jgi:hypothetical protein
MEYNGRFLTCLFHLSSDGWAKSIPNHIFMRWIGEKWREWLAKNSRSAHDRLSLEDHRKFDDWLRSLPRRVVFIDEKDAADVPELKLGKTYFACNFDGQLLDVLSDDGVRIGTYCVERFSPN